MNVLQEAKQLVENGSKEIVLLGQNVNAYSYKNNRLSDLIFEISKIKNLKRIRYTTSHPRDFTKDLIEIHKTCNKLMPLIHLPIQSGSTKILESMNRGHTSQNYLNIIEDILNKNNSVKFSSDFIIAYPGETDSDFQKTIALMKKIKFINSYSYVYSARPGTPASKLKKVNDAIARERLQIFQRLANEIKMKYRNKLLNSSVSVLFENKLNKQNKYFGRDEYSNSIIVQSNDNLVGKIQKVKINKINLNTLFGELIEEKTHNYAA